MSGVPVQPVTVTVDSSGTILCSPDPVIVKGPNVLLAFKLKTDGYAFAERNAITVDNPGSDFPYPSWTVKPQLATLLDLDGKVGSYSYNVSVVRCETGECIDGDPTIQNET
ncbi:hypothetical protein HLB44_22455 [Aquincola sp. S2]|uniref:Uncharacterized protein n=1 Tax=Pseudaquabacterium terrae TaxID=2732868 RepID=A0ABX2EM86_9BURK|nr:hypothetical protein [Aquabacterium terrae]NRF69771.1 hypothetical protein [Aquabacterium terrae]